MAEGLYGITALVLGGGFSMGVAYLSRPKPEHAERRARAGAEQPDLTTIAGLADAIVADRREIEEQGLRIRTLEHEKVADRKEISALRRYMRTMKDALLRADIPVPEPAPRDAQFIRD